MLYNRIDDCKIFFVLSSNLFVQSGMGGRLCGSSGSQLCKSLDRNISPQRTTLVPHTLKRCWILPLSKDTLRPHFENNVFPFQPGSIRTLEHPSWWEFVQWLIANKLHPERCWLVSFYPMLKISNCLTKRCRFDEHWQPYSIHCAVCSLPYNYILKVDFSRILIQAQTKIMKTN